MKKVKFVLMAAIMPMMLAACGNDEPPAPPGGGDPENPSPSVSEEKPILFETKSMFWKTGYDAALNVYDTYCIDTQSYGGQDIVYRYLDGADNPGKLLVTDFSIEKGGETRVLDVSKIKEQAEASDYGFFEAEIEGVTLKYAAPGEFVVSYAPETYEEIAEMLAAKIESRFYNIKLEGDGNYKSAIRIEDGIELTAGQTSLPFDMTEIQYPTDRGYDHNGAKCASTYNIYLPAKNCNFSLISSDIYNGKHFYIMHLRENNEDGSYNDLPLEVIEEERLGESDRYGGVWYYVQENKVGKFTHKEDYKLDCEIKANTSGNERVLELLVSNIKSGWEGPYMMASFIIIQAAE